MSAHPELAAAPSGPAVAQPVRARPRRRRRARALGIAALAGVACCSAAAGALYADLPGVADAPARVDAIAHAHGGRTLLVAVASRAARATVAIEDRRFFQHGAIDPVAIGRVLVDSVIHPGVDPGGSTIAQQLAKVVYDEPPTLVGRLRAIGLAFKLERGYTKARILSLYMNAIYYGHGFWGVRQASRGYFARSPRHLSWPQAALLAGLPQAPSLLDPFTHPAAARDRRAQVVSELVRAGALTPSQGRRVDAAALGLR
jgi:membrane peptidoglycan carboxypeptidase